jgi:phosphomannomutase
MAGIFKAYDVRGIVPSQLNEENAYTIGLAFQHVLDAEDRAFGNTMLVSRDMRESGEGLQNALVRGLTDAGLDVLDIGLSTTPMNYFAISHFKTAGGVQVTASHNPAEYNGFKFSRHGARPVSGDHGIALMERKIQEGDLPKAATPGKVTKGEVFADYQRHVLSFLRGDGQGGAGQRLKVVADAANGMGTIDQPILEAMGIDLTTLYFELDGRFPNHEANPLKEENLVDLQKLVREHGADLGISFDGDSDRAAFIDETGEAIGSDLMTGLIGGILLEREPGKVVVYDLRSSRAVAEYLKEKGGIPMRERVGHSFIKATMRKHQAIFGGELAGHYYFRDHSYADCPLLSVVEVLNLMRQTGKPLSELVQPLRRYHKSQEINFEVADKQAKMDELATRYKDAEIDYLDGITFQYPDWWANVRPSNTEPFLRLVLEAKTAEELESRKEELFRILGEPAE